MENSNRSTYVLNQAIKKCQCLTFKVNFYVKNYPNLSLFLLLKNINLGACFFVIVIFENFLKELYLLKSCLFFDNMLISQNVFLWKSAIYHSIKLRFNAEVAEKFLNGMYWLGFTAKQWMIDDILTLSPKRNMFWNEPSRDHHSCRAMAYYYILPMHGIKVFFSKMIGFHR